MLPINNSIDGLMRDAAAAGFVPDPPKIPLIRCSDLLKPQPVKWLIRGVLESGVIAGVFGAPASGKSFVAVDMALCIASGKEWNGRKVDTGGVVYFAGEGQAGLRRRISAWVQSNPDAWEAVGNFYLAERACVLPGEVADAIQSIKGVKDLRLVILDTLQRTMDGDENSTKDMSAYVRALDAIRSCNPDLSVMVVHHTGHGSSERARGSSALKASLDAEIMISRNDDGAIEMKSTKAKDSEPFDPVYFALKGVSLDGWGDDDGSPVTSAVLEYLDGKREGLIPEWKRKKNGKNQDKAMTVLETLYQAQSRNLAENGHDPKGAQVKVDDWINDCVKQGITKKPAYFRRDVLGALLKKGVIRIPNGGVYVEVVYIGEGEEKGEAGGEKVRNGEEGSM